MTPKAAQKNVTKYNIKWWFTLQ